MSNKKQILVVDDEETIRKLLKSRLERDGYDVTIATNGDEAEKYLTSGTEYHCVVTDLKMPGKDGFQVLNIARDKNAFTKVIVITGHGEKEVAVKALRTGASDYLEKPFDMEELSHSVKRCVKEYTFDKEKTESIDSLKARVERVEGKTEDQFWFVSKSATMEKVNEWLLVLRRESMRGEAEEPSVLILGESGTGKEGIARMVHTGSRRARGPWVAVNCANFSEQLLESELFGHEKGAFTGAVTMKRGLFEIAKGGTLFLDEIGEMDVKLQAKLLRVLQEKVFRRVGGTQDIETNVRIVAATNQDLKERCDKGAFREDLYHRLSRVVVDVPPLRDRKDDIIPMAKEFARRAFGGRGKSFEGFTSEAEQSMQTYYWPGNVRELLNVIERVALVWNGSGPITLKALSIPASAAPAVNGQPGLKVVQNPFTSPAEAGLDGYMKLKKQWLESFEKEYLMTALNRNGGNVSAAAREAKIDRSNFLRLLRRYSIKSVDFKKAA